MSPAPLPRSIRGRLTAWYALALAGGLLVFAFASLAVLSVELERRNDQFLVDARRAFLVELDVELGEMPTPVEAIDRALGEVHFEGTRFLVLSDPAALVHATPADDRIAPGGEAYADAARVVFDSVVIARLRVLRSAADVRREPPDVRSPQIFTISVEPPAAGGTPERAAVTGEDARVALDVVRLRDQLYAVAALRERQGIHETMHEVRRAYLFVIPFILLLAVGVGYWLARRALAPVAFMSRRAHTMGMASLHERLPVQNPHDELGSLAGVMNELLSRLDDGVAQQRRFVADASHELRTPVAILRAEAEVTLSHPTRAEPEYRAALDVMRTTTERLSRIVEDLFLLARADGGQRMIETRPFYIDELLADVVRAMTPVAAQRDVQITFGSPPTTENGPACLGDADLLHRLFLNLLDNAVKHSPRGGRVDVALVQDDESYVVDVQDEGPGIPSDAQALVFDRFFRVDAARTRAPIGARSTSSAPVASADSTSKPSSGAGLGLSIARWIAQAHAGTVMLHASSADGSCFRVVLPVHGIHRE